MLVIITSFRKQSASSEYVYILLQQYFEARNYNIAGAFKNSASQYYLTGGPRTAAGFVSLLLRSDH
jgi:hypothetical protein